MEAEDRRGRTASETTQTRNFLDEMIRSSSPEPLFPGGGALLYSSLSGRTESMGDQTADIGGHPAVCVRGQSSVEDHGRS